MLKRNLCPICSQNAVAINYIRDGVHHYRNSCSACIRIGRKLKKDPPTWQRAGYKKKPQCEKCGFKFKLAEQSNVFYVDGNLKNNNDFNLKTVCLNCTREVYKSQLPWKSAPIVPDF